MGSENRIDMPLVYRLTDTERAAYRRFAALALPRHTSYPIAPCWNSDYGPAQFRGDLCQSAFSRVPLSLYVHVPFCERLCWYCACTKEIVPAASRRLNDPSEAFLSSLEVEAGRMAGLAEWSEVHQVHLGGGSPTYLAADQLRRLWSILRNRFQIAKDAEIAVEVDPRITSFEQLETLRHLGFNRISLGVQDFSPVVQKAVNRIQPFDLVQRCVGWARTLGFASINFDLIYGLPFQTLSSMADTIEQTISLSPDRIAFYRLAVIPEMFRWQNVFHAADLPDSDLTLDLNLQAINQFLAAGYEFIGLDHFARPSEALARAAHAGTLRRTFQGMTTGKGLDVLGFGPSAVSQLDNAFAQNIKSVHDWAAAVELDLATERGLRLNRDDRIRREVLQALYGFGVVDKRAVEANFGIDFDEYFDDELSRLADLVEEGLVSLESERICLTEPLGRLLVRVAAAVFDRYLPRDAYWTGLPAAMASKVG